MSSRKNPDFYLGLGTRVNTVCALTCANTYHTHAFIRRSVKHKFDLRNAVTEHIKYSALEGRAFWRAAWGS